MTQARNYTLTVQAMHFHPENAEAVRDWIDSPEKGQLDADKTGFMYYDRYLKSHRLVFNGTWIVLMPEGAYHYYTDAQFKNLFKVSVEKDMSEDVV